MLNLEQWSELDEQIHVAETDERYKQYAGLDFSEEVIKRLAEIKSANAEIFLKCFTKPRALYLSALESIADSGAKELELKLHKARNQNITVPGFKFGDTAVNWSNWRQFNRVQRDDRVRKAVFDGFIKKSYKLEPIIRNRFATIAKIYRKYSEEKVTPLGSYLESEGVSYSELVTFVKKMGRRARKPFADSLYTISRTILGREAE